MDLPRALGETLEKGRPEYDRLVRRVRWGEGPLLIVAGGGATAASLAGVYAFESLLGWPVVSHSAADFEAYAISNLKPRSVLILIPEAEPSELTLSMARTAKSRGATVLALRCEPHESLDSLCEGFIDVRAVEGRSRAATAVCEHAALSYFALVAARVLLRPRPEFDTLAQEFDALPQKVEWVLTQLSDAVCSWAAEAKGLHSWMVAGAGFYHPAAMHGAATLSALGIDARAISVVDAAGESLPALSSDAGVILVSGSRSRARKHMQTFAERLKGSRARVFSVTDTNDRSLVELSRMALLLPTMSEMVGSLLAATLLDWMSYHLARERGTTR